MYTYKEYTVSVKGNIAGSDVIKVIPDSTFKMSQSGKSDIDTAITQSKTEFTYSDGVRADAPVEGLGTVQMASMSAGKWNGTFYFNLESTVDTSLTNSTGSVTDDIINTVKVGQDAGQNKETEYNNVKTGSRIRVKASNKDGDNLHATANDITGKEKTDLLNILDDSGLIDSKDIDALIEVESDSFTDLASTTFYVSDIAEVGDTVVILHYNESTNEWEYIGEDTVKEDGTITKNFSSYSPVAFAVYKNNELQNVPVAQQLEAGLYDENDNKIMTWDEVISNTELSVMADGTLF